jgi:hypothetical protein
MEPHTDHHFSATAQPIELPHRMLKPTFTSLNLLARANSWRDCV